MKKIIFTLGILGAMLQYSCSKDDTPEDYILESVSIVKFANNLPPITFEDPQNIDFSEQLIDLNNNVSEFRLALKATIDGTQYETDNYLTFTSFPATINITSQNLADALELDPDDFGYKDTFEFLGFATRNDGEIFDEENLTITNTLSAMKFQSVIACATYEASSLPGSWSVVVDGWGDYLPGDEVLVESGPNANTFHILNTSNPGIDNSDTAYIIVTVDEEGNVTNITTNEPYDYGVLVNLLDGGNGLVSPCGGVIDINIDFNLEGESQGIYNFVLEKN